MKRIAPESLAFDIDGVVADTMAVFLDVAEKKYGYGGLSQDMIKTYMLEECLPIPEDVIIRIVEELLLMSHEMPLPPIPGAVPALMHLAKMESPLVFITARPGREKIAGWLSETIGIPEERFTVIATGSFEAKSDALVRAGRSVLVEDRLETCFLLSEAGFSPVVFAQPWNRKPHPFPEVGSWQELSACIQGMP
ncbi:MAG: haloacid dehalogenase [Thermodesulfobacteriota bacterium]